MTLFYSQSEPNWAEALKTLGDFLSQSVMAQDGPSPEVVKSLSVQIAGAIENDLRKLEPELSFILKAGEDEEELTQRNIALLRRWHREGSPSLAALCIEGLRQFELHLSPDLTQAMLAACILGEIENALPYHNNMHFKKVLLQLLRLISAHNHIYEGTARALRPHQIALLIIAACIHDFQHDGLGNTVKGHFEAGRLERHSFDTALPYLVAAGLPLGESARVLKIMLLCTDVSPLGDPVNMMNQMKAAYRFHYLDNKVQMVRLNLDYDIIALEKDPDLTLLCLLLHEADVGTSAGLGYEVTQYETALFRKEIGEQDARPSHIIAFLDAVCQHRMLSDAAQKLYAANMARIYALAEEEVGAGDASFILTDMPVFPGASDEIPNSRTVN